MKNEENVHVNTYLELLVNFLVPRVEPPAEVD